MIVYPDIHTHKEHPHAIYNCLAHFKEARQPWLSMGLHPWYLKEEKLLEDCALLEEACLSKSVLAIGECGLDKVCDRSWELQKQAFAFQIALAHRTQKPLIIHCVKAFDEVLKMLAHHSTPVVFHGFNKSWELAAQLVDKGFYLSFGKSIFSPEKADIFRKLAADRLFLETDTGSIPVEEIYAEAARIRQITIAEMIDIVEKNVLLVFGTKL